MDVKFRILWVEDTKEWYNSVSRRLEKYILSKALIPEFVRVDKAANFSLDSYDISKYDLLFVDFELEKYSESDENGIAQRKHGTDIIDTVREGKYYNDVLFYSSYGYSILEKVLKEEGMQGVFISDRDNKDFMECACALVDKIIKRSETLINIRGIVMDTTSGFDNQIEEIILKIWDKLSKVEEEKISKKTIKEILKESEKQSQKMLEQFQSIDSGNISELLKKREFTAAHKAHLLSWCIKESNEMNGLIKPILEKSFADEADINFYKRYSKDIIEYRNALAHAKEKEDELGTKYVGEIDGASVEFGPELCELVRQKLLQYTQLLNNIATL